MTTKKLQIMTTSEKLSKQFTKLNKEYVKIDKQMNAIAMTQCTWDLEQKLEEIQNKMSKISILLENL
jgi:hypothetical protein